MIRTVWNLTNYLNLNKLQDLFYSLQQEGSSLCWTIYISFYTLLEIIPINSIAILLIWLSRHYENDTEKKPILRNAAFVANNGATFQNSEPVGIGIDRSAMEINRGTDTRPSSLGSNYSSGGDVPTEPTTIPTPLKIDARDLIDSEPSSLSSSLGASWGRLRRSAEEDAEEEEDEGSTGPPSRDSPVDLDETDNDASPRETDPLTQHS